MGLGVFGHVVHLLIDVVEQCRDQLHRGHAALLSGEGCHADQHGGVVRRRQAQKCILLVCKGLYIFIVCQRLTPSVNTAQPAGVLGALSPPAVEASGLAPISCPATHALRISTDGVKSAECPTNVKEVVARFEP